MTTLAFYKGQGGLFAALIRWATRSQYSHVELISGSVRYGDKVMCWSSSERDHGVRGKVILLDPDKWDLVSYPAAPLSALKFIKRHDGAGYDWLGILLSQILNLNRGRKARWYCSEICAAALDISPCNISPGALYEAVQSIKRQNERLTRETENV